MTTTHQLAANVAPNAASGLHSVLAGLSAAQLHDAEKALLAALGGQYAEAGLEGSRAGLWNQGSALVSGVILGASAAPLLGAWPRLALVAVLLVVGCICLAGANWHYRRAMATRDYAAHLRRQLDAIRQEFARRGMGE